jgi:ubiquinol-cytochrome c reductase iron-sulfur subunit
MSRLRLIATAMLGLVGVGAGRGQRRRRVPTGEPAPRAELVLIGLLLLATICSVGFIFVYADDGLHHRTQYEGIALALALAFLAAALILVAKRLIVNEELEEEYPQTEHPEEQLAVAEIVRDSGSRFTRKRLLAGVASLAGGAFGLALLTPVLSLGPAFESSLLANTPWRRGRRLVSEDDAPIKAADIEEGTFYIAFPEGASHDTVGAPVIVVRMPPNQLKLPRGRRGWAPQGILAYSQVCTHAGCSITLYRTPLFPPVEAKPAFVCPCHYSTFNPATGGTVLFGPAGRDLPQLPLQIDATGHLRAGGNFSGPPGPSWWGVRMYKARFGQE